MTRNLHSFGIAVVITLGLTLGMSALIKMDEPELSRAHQSSLANFNQAPANEEVRIELPKPIRPAPVVDKPEVPETVIERDKIDIDKGSGLTPMDSGDERTISILAPTGGDYLPIFRAPPVYPRIAAERGLCGWVELAFTVTADGGVTNPIVTASSSSVFESAAINAALKYKYKPREEGGKAVSVSNVPVRIVFEMENGC